MWLKIPGMDPYQYLVVDSHMLELIGTTRRSLFPGPIPVLRASTRQASPDVAVSNITRIGCQDTGYYPQFGGEQTTCQEFAALGAGVDVGRKVAVAAGLYAQTPKGSREY
jgi:hypothetical protein